MMKKTSVIILIGLMLGLTAIYPLNWSSKTFVYAQSTAPSISMPVEYVNYTVSPVNGSLWASVDGTYPMQIPQAWVGQQLPMIYPMPTGVTNISIELNGQKVAFGNLTQADPDMLHYTYLGEWQIIFFTVQPTTPNFVLTVHYQHPIMKENGSYVFLYNLNINQYISNSSSESTAQFNISFPLNCYGFNVYLVAGQGALTNNTKTPVNFEISKNNGTQTVAFNIVSFYDEQPHDELVTFNVLPNTEALFLSVIILPLIAVIVIVFLLFYRRHRKTVNLKLPHIT
jgi:hypothetical protein